MSDGAAPPHPPVPPWQPPPAPVPPPRRTNTGVIALVIVLAVVCVAGLVTAGVVAFSLLPGRHHAGSSAAAHSASPSAAAGGCRYQPTEPRGKAVAPPTDTAHRPTTAVLHTTLGDLTIQLAAKAPCSVASFAHLITSRYYDGSACHRLTTPASGLAVLQCGDPTGTGTGGPGYTVPDENLPPAGTAVPYPRGTVALANTGQPNTGAAQFFICYQDVKIPPSYPILGTVSGGMPLVDQVAAAGVTPGSGPGGPGDGTPKQRIAITTAAVQG